jgi:hypothetical protein
VIRSRIVLASTAGSAAIILEVASVMSGIWNLVAKAEIAELACVRSICLVYLSQWVKNISTRRRRNDRIALVCSW